MQFGASDDSGRECEERGASRHSTKGPYTGHSDSPIFCWRAGYSGSDAQQVTGNAADRPRRICRSADAGVQGQHTGFRGGGAAGAEQDDPDRRLDSASGRKRERRCGGNYAQHSEGAQLGQHVEHGAAIYACKFAVQKLARHAGERRKKGRQDDIYRCEQPGGVHAGDDRRHGEGIPAAERQSGSWSQWSARGQRWTRGQCCTRGPCCTRGGGHRPTDKCSGLPYLHLRIPEAASLRKPFARHHSDTKRSDPLRHADRGLLLHPRKRLGVI